MAEGEIRLTVALAAPADAVWAHATSIAGVDLELRPWLRMRFPRHLRGRSLGEAETGVRLGRCWMLLFGVVPVEFDDLAFVEIDRFRFFERSRMATLAVWEHERSVEPVDRQACVLTDRVRWRPRRPLPSRLVRVIVRTLFAHRHNRLVSRFGRTIG